MNMLTNVRINDLRLSWRDYYNLCKARVVAVLLLTAVVLVYVQVQQLLLIMYWIDGSML